MPKATLSIDGPYDQGNMPLVCGIQYIFHLGFDSTTGVELAVVAQVDEITPSNDAEGAPNVTITAQSTGAFSASIV